MSKPSKSRAFHPELAGAARWIPRKLPLWGWSAPLMNFVIGRIPKASSTASVTIEDVQVPGLPGAPGVTVRTYRPAAAPADGPALLWFHGGGLVIGAPVMDDARCIALAERLGVFVASVDYRLAVDAPYPAAIDDCEAALRWLRSHRPEGTPVAVAGESAGGGLAAALAQRATDLGLAVALQVLIYPMLDDRTTLRTDVDPRGLRLWGPGNNRFGWGRYLGEACAGPDVPGDAAPARRDDLSGLPPAWIGVGTADLFLDEDVAYAERLKEAGVPCTLKVVEGAFHGFESFAVGAPVSAAFTADYVAALRVALFGAGDGEAVSI